MLTLARVPVALLAPLVASSPRSLLALYLTGVGTDVIDGMVARRTGTTSQTGAYADGIADKLFHIVIGLVLVGWGYVPAWWIPLWFTRELVQAVLIARYYKTAFEHDDFDRDATALGKATTVLLGLTIVVVLAGFPQAALWLTLAVSLLGLASAIGYGRREARIRQQRAQQRSAQG